MPGNSLFNRDIVNIYDTAAPTTDSFDKKIGILITNYKAKFEKIVEADKDIEKEKYQETRKGITKRLDKIKSLLEQRDGQELLRFCNLLVQEDNLSIGWGFINLYDYRSFQDQLKGLVMEAIRFKLQVVGKHVSPSVPPSGIAVSTEISTTEKPQQNSSEIEKLRAEIKKLSDKIEKLPSKNAELKKNLDQGVEVAHEEGKDEVLDESKEIRKLKKENRKLKEQLADVSRKHDELLGVAEKQTKQIDELMETLRKMTEGNSNVKELRGFRAHSESLKKVVEKHSKEHKKKIKTKDVSTVKTIFNPGNEPAAASQQAYIQQGTQNQQEQKKLRQFLKFTKK